MVAAGVHQKRQLAHTPPERTAPQPSPHGSLLALQHLAGNRAVARLARQRRLAREPKPLPPAGTGFDGLRTTDMSVFPRKLNAAQAKEVERYQQFLQSTYNESTGKYDQGKWAREAGARTAAFGEASVESRAMLYAEFQRQIVLADGGGRSSWVAMVERGADGSYIFRGNAMPPGGGEQRVFVVDKNGGCWSGVRSQLTGSGPGKLPDYNKLTPLPGTVKPSGGGGTGGSGGGEGGTGGAPKTAEPPASPRVKTGGEPGVRGRGGTGVAEEAPMRLSGARIALAAANWILLALPLIRAWIFYEKNVETEEERNFKRLMNRNVEPKVQEALKAKAADAEAWNRSQAGNTVYANVTIDVDHSWTESGIGGSRSDERVSDIRFVDLKVSVINRKKEDVVSQEHGGFPGSDLVNYTETRRVTYSVALDFGETAQEKHWRFMQDSARMAVEQKISARDAARGTHWDPPWTWKDDQEEARRKKFGMRSLRAERVRQEIWLFVQAYIEYTAFYGPDKLYDDAVAYSKELEAEEARIKAQGDFEFVTAPDPRKSQLQPLGSGSGGATSSW